MSNSSYEKHPVLTKTELEAQRDPATGKLNLTPPTSQFASVAKAREVLKAQAADILAKYMAGADMALASGKYEEGLKAYQWLLDHIPAQDGKRIFDQSIDKPQQVESTHKGPMIQIGIGLGGISKPEVKLIADPHATETIETIEGEVI